MVEADQTVDGRLDSTVPTHQIATVSLVGTTVDSASFEGVDNVSIFLSGRALRDFLAGLAAAGKI